MKLYKDADELLKRELPPRITSQIYPLFVAGNVAYNQITNNQKYKNIFHSELFPNARAHLMNFLICRQFEQDMLKTSFPFDARILKVNNFGRKNIELFKENIVIHIAKAKDEDSLPSRSGYRESYSYLNRFLEKQLMFSCDDIKNISVDSEPYYIFLTYGGKDNTIDFVNLIVPNAGMTNILKKVNLKESLSLFKFSEESIAKTEEKNITKLKKEVIKKLNLDAEGENK